MAASKFRTEQYTSEHFVESAGVVLIHETERKVCLIHDKAEDLWLLPKGRRDVGESRQAAALREGKEETGFTAVMKNIIMKTRAPPAGSQVDMVYDYPKGVKGEPFMVTFRHLDEGNVKVIWWYIAVVDEGVEQEAGEAQFEAEMVGFDDAAARLTYETDREVVARALRVYKDTWLGMSM